MSVSAEEDKWPLVPTVTICVLVLIVAILVGILGIWPWYAESEVSAQVRITHIRRATRACEYAVQGTTPNCEQVHYYLTTEEVGRNATVHFHGWTEAFYGMQIQLAPEYFEGAVIETKRKRGYNWYAFYNKLLSSNQGWCVYGTDGWNGTLAVAFCGQF